MTKPFIDEMTYSTYHEIIANELRAALRRYNDKWEDLNWHNLHKSDLYLSTIEQYRLPVFVLGCTLLENAINFYLSVRCTTQEFISIQKTQAEKSLRAKWMEVPAKFVPNYKVPQDLAVDLKKLVNRRNTIIHSQPMISIDGDDRHKGNEPEIVLDEHEFVSRSAALSFRLIENLLEHDREAFISISDLRLKCGTVANEVEVGRRRLAIALKIPRELITEIMEQGYDRETTIDYAIRIGEIPKYDESGQIIVRAAGGRKRVALKPLKFFENKSKIAAWMDTLTSF